MFKECMMYEIMWLEDVGFIKMDLVFGKYSGRVVFVDWVK